jgi:hypothetical protein
MPGAYTAPASERSSIWSVIEPADGTRAATVGKRRLRYVCFLAALGQAAACLYPLMWGLGCKAQWLVEKLNAEHLLGVAQLANWRSADRLKSLWESLISILLDGNTEAAFSAELVTAVSTEIGMGFVPISICRHAMNGNLIPGVALRAVLFEGAGNFVWIVAHCCSPSF